MKLWLLLNAVLTISASFTIQLPPPSNSNSETVARIINGQDSTTEDTVVRIVSSVDNNLRGNLLTGVAVSPLRVLTVAQAIHGFNRWTIQYGTGGIVSTLQIQTSVDAVAHPQFDTVNYSFNIGIIKVDYPIGTIYPTIAPFPPPNTFLMVFGYGITESTPARILQTTVYMALSRDDCIATFTQPLISEHNNCGRTAGIAFTAPGDQGGPVLNLDRTELYSILSFWSGNNLLPSALVSVFDFVDFINENGEE